MRLLFIAPASNLASSAELMRIASGNTPEIVDGLLDRAGLERALRATSYDAVHFSGHAGKSVLNLSDGLIDSADLASMLDRQSSAEFFFINGCDSLAVATAVHNETHCPVIAHDDPIDDKAAVRFAESFYRNYKSSHSVHEAFATAKETLLRIFPSQARIPVLVNGDMATGQQLNDCMRFVKGELGEMRVQLSAIEVKVNKIESQQGRMMLVLLTLLLLAQLATPVLNHLFDR